MWKISALFSNLSFTKQHNSTLIQVERICGWQINSLCHEIYLWKSWRHCGIGKCWLTAFFPFPTMFWKVLCHRVIWTWDCLVNSQSRSCFSTINMSWFYGCFSLHYTDWLEASMRQQICRLQSKCDSNDGICLSRGRRYCWKGKNAVISGFSFFHNVSFLPHPWSLFRQWLCRKAASCFGRISCEALVKQILGKHR